MSKVKDVYGNSVSVGPNRFRNIQVEVRGVGYERGERIEVDERLKLYVKDAKVLRKALKRAIKAAEKDWK